SGLSGRDHLCRPRQCHRKAAGPHPPCPLRRGRGYALMACACRGFTSPQAPCICSAEEEVSMATGWAGDNAVNDQIDATVKDGIERARSRLPKGPSLERCEECDAPIPEARRRAVPGVRLCVACQSAHDED